MWSQCARIVKLLCRIPWHLASKFFRNTAWPHATTLPRLPRFAHYTSELEKADPTKCWVDAFFSYDPLHISGLEPKKCGCSLATFNDPVQVLPVRIADEVSISESLSDSRCKETQTPWHSQEALSQKSTMSMCHDFSGAPQIPTDLLNRIWLRKGKLEAFSASRVRFTTGVVWRCRCHVIFRWWSVLLWLSIFYHTHRYGILYHFRAFTFLQFEGRIPTPFAMLMACVRRLR